MQTLPALIRNALAAAHDAVLIERVDGSWTATSSDALLKRVEDTACAMRDAGLRSGDRIALISPDCVDWVVADFAVLFAGCVVVPIFPNQADDHITYILRDSQVRLGFCDGASAARVQALMPDLELVVFGDAGEGGMREFERRGIAARDTQPQWPKVFEDSLDPRDLAILSYTSGTTGEPKGVMLSHDNLAFTVRSAFGYAFDVLTPESPVLSVLPFSHIYEHCILYGYLISHVRHYICHGADELLADMRDCTPVVVTTVPRILERILAGIAAKARSDGFIQARIVPWALKIGRRYMAQRVRGGSVSALLALRFRIARALVLRKIKAALGLQKVHYLVSGSAPLHFDIAMTFLSCGIPIIEGYGPTECSPVVSVNTLRDNQYGTVGKAIPGVEIRIAPDGEICVRGRNVMQGYYKQADATEAVLDKGWYKTGDIGTLDGEGFLRITDRKRELFKTSGGNFIAPSRVETAIKRSVYVTQAVVVGNGRPFPLALVVPNWQLLCGVHNQRDFLSQEVSAQTADLATFERVRRIVVLPRELSIAEGELSPTLKVRRRAVERRYAAEIEAAYAQVDAV